MMRKTPAARLLTSLDMMAIARALVMQGSSATQARSQSSEMKRQAYQRLHGVACPW
jgi:hypothetical protein